MGSVMKIARDYRNKTVTFNLVKLLQAELHELYTISENHANFKDALLAQFSGSPSDNHLSPTLDADRSTPQVCNDVLLGDLIFPSHTLNSADDVAFRIGILLGHYAKHSTTFDIECQACKTTLADELSARSKQPIWSAFATLVPACPSNHLINDNDDAVRPSTFDQIDMELDEFFFGPFFRPSYDQDLSSSLQPSNHLIYDNDNAIRLSTFDKLDKELDESFFGPSYQDDDETPEVIVNKPKSSPSLEVVDSEKNPPPPSAQEKSAYEMERSHNMDAVEVEGAQSPKRGRIEALKLNASLGIEAAQAGSASRKLEHNLIGLGSFKETGGVALSR